MFAGKKRMGQRGWREKVSLYFSTSCLFSCVRIDFQRWYEMHVGGLFDLVWVRVAYLVSLCIVYFFFLVFVLVRLTYLCLFYFLLFDFLLFERLCHVI